MAQKSETLAGLDALITQARHRLERNPDYIALRALEQARDLILQETGAVFVDDTTGELLRLVPAVSPAGKAPSQLEAAITALSQAREPLSTPDLVRRVRELGGTVGGKDPNVNLGSTLSRSDKIRSVRWKGRPAWWLKTQALPNEGVADLISPKAAE